MQKDQHEPAPQQPELSDVWQELLGHSTGKAAPTPSSSPEEASPEGEVIPTLESDPWNELTQATGTEIVDVEAIHLGVDDQDMEQALQVMQEHSEPPDDKTQKFDKLKFNKPDKTV